MDYSISFVDTQKQYKNPKNEMGIMRVRASETLRLELESEIATGQLLPGDRIDEQGIAKRFDVSRTPAREALLQLATSGLVRLVPRQGAVVTGLSPALAVGMAETLAALEAEAARLATRRMSVGDRRNLTEIHAASRNAVQCNNVDAYSEANTAFHAAIYAGACNEYLGEQIRAARTRLAMTLKATLHQAGRLAASLSEHERVLAAINAGDELAARDAMSAHSTIGGTIFADIVARTTSTAR